MAAWIFILWSGVLLVVHAKHNRADAAFQQYLIDLVFICHGSSRAAGALDP